MRISDWSSDVCSSDLTIERLQRHEAAIMRLARLETIGSAAALAGGAAQVIVDEAIFVLPLDGVIDLDAERSRLAKALNAAEQRSEERRVGKEWVSTCRSRWSPDN